MIAGRHQPHSMETATPAPPEIAVQLDAARAWLVDSGADQAALEAGVEAARTVAALTHDADLALGTMLHRLRQAGLSREDPQIDGRLGGARELSAPRGQGLARETREILAPLANRLGVWSLKWELEDLSFRYLEPEAYHRIAAALAERRMDRERYIKDVCEL